MPFVSSLHIFEFIQTNPSANLKKNARERKKYGVCMKCYFLCFNKHIVHSLNIKDIRIKDL